MKDWIKKYAFDVFAILAAVLALIFVFDFEGRDGIIWRSLSAISQTKEIIVNGISAIGSRLSSLEGI